MTIEPDRCASPKLATNANAATFALLSLVTLGVAVFLPLMTVRQLFGEETYSILGAVRRMWGEGQYFLAALVGGFSIVFPVVKNGLLLVVTSSSVELTIEERQALHQFTSAVARYSMLDVFVVAILVVILKTGGLFEVTVGWGLFAFCAAIGLSITASACIRLEETRHE